MDPKKALTSGVFCPMPWTGLMYNLDGSVKNCIRSSGEIGNIKDHSIQDILKGQLNTDTQEKMLSDQPGSFCQPCYDLERGKKKFDIVSDRIFYLRELKSVPFDTYKLGNHDLQTIDVRWSNLCNFSCVYCRPANSSKWAQELGVIIETPSADKKARFKEYIFDHVKNLKHVYLAGGEPLLMKENLELLQLLKEQNPKVNLRINTNLSKTDTKIFETICEFENVHWTISVESMGDEFEYIRTGGNWNEFLQNLTVVKDLDHKVSFNMLYFLLNYDTFFDCLEYLRNLGFHANSFIAGPLFDPVYLNVRNLPNDVLQSVKTRMEDLINQKPGYLLEDSLRNILHYIQQPFEKNLANSFARLKLMDQRRNLDSSKIFTELYKLA